jgi:hypothetical protein
MRRYQFRSKVVSNTIRRIQMRRPIPPPNDLQELGIARRRRRRLERRPYRRDRARRGYPRRALRLAARLASVLDQNCGRPPREPALHHLRLELGPDPVPQDG